MGSLGLARGLVLGFALAVIGIVPVTAGQRNANGYFDDTATVQFRYDNGFSTNDYVVSVQVDSAWNFACAGQPQIQFVLPETVTEVYASYNSDPANPLCRNRVVPSVVATAVYPDESILVGVNYQGPRRVERRRTPMMIFATASVDGIVFRTCANVGKVGRPIVCQARMPQG